MKKQPTIRVFRGGAFSNFAVRARCAFRYGHYPDLRHDGIGFRVVGATTSNNLTSLQVTKIPNLIYRRLK